MKNISNEEYRIKNTESLKNFYIGLVIVITSVLTVILSLNNKPQDYTLIPLLPISFGICSCLFANVYRYVFKKLSVTLILGTYFFRLVLLPFILMLGDYSSLILNTDVYKNMDKAIILLIYELVVVFIALSLSVRKSAVIDNEEEHYLNMYDVKSKLFKVILGIMIIFEVVSLVSYPDLSTYVDFFIKTNSQDSIQYAIKFMRMMEVVPRYIYRFYIFIFSLLQIIIPALIIQLINKKCKSKNKAVFFTFIVIIMTLVYMTDEKFASILVGINLFLLAYYLYPKQIRRFVPIMCLGLITIVFAGLIFKSGINEKENFFVGFSETISSYFSGPANLAVALELKEHFNAKIILGDIGNSLPFMGYFFKELITTPKLFNNALYGSIGRVDQIIPMVGQGFSYFGLIFAPIFSYLCVKLSVKFDNMSNENGKLLKRYIYTMTSMIFSICPILYNFNILISMISNAVIIMILIKLAYRKKT